MNWINSEERLPEDGQVVAVIVYHHKQHWPLSVEIFFGKVESCKDRKGKRMARAQTEDFTGYGLVAYDLSDINDDNYACAWCDAKEFKKPDFITHDPWWGKCITEAPERKE